MIAALVVALFLGIWAGARRFERWQRQLERWDEYGPLVETRPPPRGMRGTIMMWQMEALGKWKAKVVRRRRLHEPPPE